MRRRLQTEYSEILDNQLLELVLRDKGLEYIPERAIHIQKYHVRQSSGLCMGQITSLQIFLERMNDLDC
jgi:hypothetical protein